MRAFLTTLFFLVSALHFHAQSRLFLSASDSDGALSGAIDLSTGQLEWVTPSPKPAKLLTTADGQHLVAPVQGSILLVDVNTLAVSRIAEGAPIVGSTVIAHPRRLEFYGWLTNGELVAITTQAVRTLFACAGGKGPAISGDGRRLVVTCGQDIVVLDADTGELIKQFSTGRIIDFPATNIDGSRVVVLERCPTLVPPDATLGDEIYCWNRPEFDLSLYDAPSGVRLIERISPNLSSFNSIVSILATTPTRDALLVVDFYAYGLSCGYGLQVHVVEFDTLAIRQSTELRDSRDEGVTGGFTADGKLAAIGWTHRILTCGYYHAGVSLYDVPADRIVVSIDLPVTTKSIVLAIANAPLPPDTPTAQVDGNRVTLSWTLPTASAAATRYVVEAGSAAGLSDLAVIEVDGTQTSLVVDNVPPGRYVVRVRAVNHTGRSGPSQEVIVL